LHIGARSYDALQPALQPPRPASTSYTELRRLRDANFPAAPTTAAAKGTAPTTPAPRRPRAPGRDNDLTR